jgi:hypothetical protein
MPIDAEEHSAHTDSSRVKELIDVFEARASSVILPKELEQLEAASGGMPEAATYADEVTPVVTGPPPSENFLSTDDHHSNAYTHASDDKVRVAFLSSTALSRFWVIIYVSFISHPLLFLGIVCLLFHFIRNLLWRTRILMVRPKWQPPL